MASEPPRSVVMAYSKVGPSHVFTACGYAGIYLGSASFAASYGCIAPALSAHLSEVHGKPVDYRVPDLGDAFPRPPRAGAVVFAALVLAPAEQGSET